MQFKNFDTMASDLDFKDKGNYYSCLCPCCSKKSGFMYKNELLKKEPKIRCHSANSCGEVTSIVLEDRIIEKNIIDSIKLESEKEITTSEQKELEIMVKNLNRILELKNYSANDFLTSRGLEENSGFWIDLKKLKCSKKEFYETFQNQCKHLDFSKILESYDFEKRDLLSWTENDGLLDSIILRSTDKTVTLKEITFPISSVRHCNFWQQKGVPEDNKIFVTEGVMDALAIQSIHEEKISFFALKGALSQSRLQNKIKNDKNYQNKEFVLCFDNDEAGRKGSEKFAAFLNSQNIKYVDFDFSNLKSKDMNDALVNEKDLFVNAFKNFKKKITLEDIEMNKNIEITNISEKEYGSVKLTSRQVTVKTGDLSVNGWYKTTATGQKWFEPATNGKSYINSAGETKYERPVTLQKALGNAVASTVEKALESNTFPTKENPLLVETVNLPENYQKPVVNIKTETEKGTYANVMKDGLFINGVFFNKEKDTFNFPSGKPYEKTNESGKAEIVYPQIVLANKETRDEIRVEFEKALMQHEKNKQFEAEKFEEFDPALENLDELLPF